MKTVTKYSGDVARSPKNALEEMRKTASDFITWVNKHNVKRYIAKKEYVEILAYNASCLKSEERRPLDSSKCIEIASSLNTDEARLELLAANVSSLIIKEGFSSITVITNESIDIIEQVLYNDKFDCELLFKQ